MYRTFRSKIIIYQLKYKKKCRKSEKIDWMNNWSFYYKYVKVY